MEPKDEIKQKLDLAELIGEYVPLKPSGTAGFKGLCPFHSEKTPSFTVSPDKQIWHCFGCSEGGDCFSFVMKMEGMTFPEALMHLGKKTGVEIRRFSSTQNNSKQRMYAINELAQKFFEKVLRDSTGAKAARKYVESRGIIPELVERFALGHAPDEWDALSSLLVKRGYSEGEAVQAGLSLKRKSGRGVIDRFRNRLMIPLRDNHGNVVGFTGRLLSPDKQSPKYMNSPETLIYHKGELVYGLDLAKRAIRDAKVVVITEGNLDVVASHKAEVENTVASSGTALTQDQLELLKRYTDTIIFAFDTDAAGFKAAKKGMSLARELGFDLRAAVLPEGINDPDDLVQKNPEQWKTLVGESVPIMEFLIAHVTRGKDLTNIDDKRAAARELLPPIGQMQGVVEREHWLQRVGDLLGVGVDVLRKSVGRNHKPQSTSFKQMTKPKQRVTSISKEEKARSLIFGYLMQANDLFDKVHARLVVAFEDHNLWITLYNLAHAEYYQESKPAQKSYFSRLRDKVQAHDDQETLTRLLDASTLMAEQTFQGMSPTKALGHIENLFQILESAQQKKLRSELARKLRLAEQAGDNHAVAELLKQLKK